MYIAKYMEKLSLWRDSQGLSIMRNGGLKFRLSKIGVDTFNLIALAIVKTIKQTKRDSV